MQVKITVDTGDYGTVFGQGEVIIGYDYEIFIICDAGYKISQAIVNGQVVNVIRNKILLKNVKEDINIIILFEKIVL